MKPGARREKTFIYIQDFSKAIVAIRKKNWEKVKALRQQGKYAILVYDKIYSQDKLQVNNLLKLSYNQQKNNNSNNNNKNENLGSKQ